MWRIILLVLLFALSSSWIGFQWKGWQLRRSMERRVKELKEEAESRNGPRPVLRGTPVPGNAWDDYLRAIEPIKATPGFPGTGKFLSRSPDADRAGIQALLTQYKSCLDWLQKGTHRSEWRRIRMDHDGHPRKLTEDGHPLFYRFNKLAALALCQSRFLVEEGKNHDAVELLLDLCQFGFDLRRDTSETSEACGDVSLKLAFDELGSLLLKKELSQADLR